MSQRWSDLPLASSTQLNGVSQQSVHLSDGTLVWLDYDGSHTYVRYSSDHATVNNAYTYTGSLALYTNAATPVVALCRDASDNLYVVYSVGWALGVQAFTKGSGYSWTAQTAAFDPASPGTAPCAAAAVWCNTTGGTGGAGHVMVIGRAVGAAAEMFYAVFDAGALLAGSANVTSQGTNPTFLVGGSAAGLANPDLCTGLSPDGFGSTGGLGITSVGTTLSVGSWSLDSTGALSTNTNLGAVSMYAGTTDQTARAVRVASNLWAVICSAPTTAQYRCSSFSSTAEITSSVDSGTPANMPLNASIITWDAFNDPDVSGRAWVIASAPLSTSSVPMWRLSVDVTSGIAWATTATADDTLTSLSATPTQVQAVSQPVAMYVDWMAVAKGSSADRALYGDGTLFATAPYSPTLTTPSNASYIDATSGVTFAGTYNSTDGANANARALRMKIAGASAYSYWNQSTAAWQSTIVWNPVTIAPGASGSFGPITGGLSNGTTINWSMADQESSGNLQGAFASDFTVNLQVAPNLTVSAPTGTVTTTDSPSLDYTPAPPSGATITGGRWLVYTAAQTIDIGAGTIPAGAVSDVSWTGNPLTVALQAGVALTSGATYYAYAAVEESGSEWSSTISTTFTISLTPPATPTITATAGTVHGVPTAVLQVQGSAPGGGVPTPTTATIRRSDGLYVRGASPANPLPLNGSQYADVGDAECAPGVGYTYTAVVSAAVGAGATVSSVPSAASGAVTLTLAQPDLTDPLDPSTAVLVNLAGDSLVRDEPEVQGIFRPLGRKTAVVVRGDMLAEEFDLSLMFYADGDAGWQAFNALRQRRSVVMLRGDMPGDLWYVTLGSARPMTLSRTSGRISQPVRGVVVHCTPADRPPV